MESVTPAAHTERGSQVALRCPDAEEVMRRLIARGVVGDFRAPDVLRFGFTPLYLGFADVERAARVLAEVVAEADAAEPPPLTQRDIRVRAHVTGLIPSRPSAGNPPATVSPIPHRR